MTENVLHLKVLLISLLMLGDPPRIQSTNIIGCSVELHYRLYTVILSGQKSKFCLLIDRLVKETLNHILGFTRFIMTIFSTSWCTIPSNI